MLRHNELPAVQRFASEFDAALHPGGANESLPAVQIPGSVCTSALTTPVFPFTFDSLRTLAGLFVQKTALIPSFDAKIAAAEAAAMRGDTKAEHNILDALTNELRAQSGKALTEQDANTLIIIVRTF